MRFYKKTYTLLIALLPMFAFSQSQMEEVALETVLENELTAITLQPVQLQNFHQRARQKLEDFADMLTLLSNEDMAPELRREVAKAALGFFSDKNAVMHWHDLKTGKITELPLGVFLENMQAGQANIVVAFSEISGDVPLACPPPSCTWDMHFSISQTPSNGPALSASATMAIILKKQEKYFGAEKKEVWGVFLGEIKRVGLRP